VLAEILLIGSAIPISKVAGHGTGAADFEGGAEDINLLGDLLGELVHSMIKIKLILLK
jgi:hypothetical protein